MRSVHLWSIHHILFKNNLIIKIGIKKYGKCCIFSGTYRVKACISYKKYKIRLNLITWKSIIIFVLKMFFVEKKKIKSGTRMSPENNVLYKEIMIRKMYESSQLHKSVLGKFKIVWFLIQ